MDRYYEIKQMTKEFFSLLSEHTTSKIDLAMISHDTLMHKDNGKCVYLARDIEIKEAYSILKRENAWYKNDERKENFMWRWSKDNDYNIAFVDDVAGEYVNRFKEKDNFMLIQTSERKYQGFFKLDRCVSWQELTAIQKALQGIYHGDPASTDAMHLKRIPGFKNTKYETLPVVRVAHTGSNVINVDQVMTLIRKQMREQQETERKLRQVKGVKGSIEKCWRDFYEGDESIADIKYALYLLRKGLNENEVKDRLRQESLDLRKRKGFRVEAYLDRTVDKALNYMR